MNKVIEFDNARARVYEFSEVGGVREYHVMISTTDRLATYQQQLDAVLDAYQHLIEVDLKG